jgi:hypothetical protein
LKKILIISTSRDEQQLIEDVNSRALKPDYIVETTASFGQDSSWWVVNAPEVLVVRFPNDEALEKYFIKKITDDVHVEIPIIFLAEVITSSMMQLGQKIKKQRMIKLPVTGEDLFKTVQDISTDFGPGKLQAHPRYLTNQPALITSDYAVGKMQSTMKNLSLGGAYFETTDSGLNIKPADLIKFSVTLGSNKREYIFDAKIMWIKELEASARGFGVSFVDKEEVYNHLLKGL